MLNTTTILVVFDRKKMATKANAYKPKEGLVQLSITVNGERRFQSTGIKVYADQWANGAIVNRPDARQLNEKLQNYLIQIADVVNKCDRENRRFSFHYIDDIFFKGNYKNDFIEWMSKTINSRVLADGTRKHHIKVMNYLKKMRVTDIVQLTPDTIRQIDNDLKKRIVNGNRMQETSIYGYHKIIKCYINLAIQAGLTNFNPYSQIKLSKGKSQPRTVLTMEEFQRIQHVNTTYLYLQHVRDLFIVQTYTGLSFCDLMSVDFRKTENNTLSGFRGKTGVQFITVILEPVQQILRRYNYKLPKMSYTCYNKMLQPLAAAANVDKHLTTHVARHTFATTIALANGIPIEVISKMLGHADIKTTQIYAKIRQETVSNNGERLAECLGF